MPKIHAFGSNGAGQLGIGNQMDTSFPQICLFAGPDPQEPLGRISSITAGGNHTLILSESGGIYASGSFFQGHEEATLDLYTTQRQRFRRLVTPDPKVQFCSALWEASVLVNRHQQILTQGKGTRAELGTGEVDSSCWLEVQTFPPPSTHVVDLASGVGHTVVVLADGEAWGWGDGRKGQLGEPSQIVYAPRKIKNVEFPVVRAVCGREFTYLVGEAGEGRHAILGSDKWSIRTDAPRGIPKWSEIGAGWGSILVLKTNGKIVSWGRNDHGQLAPSGLPNIKQIAVGSEHVLALTGAGRVLSWGWGEHGNCGPDVDKAGDVKGRCVKIPVQIDHDSEVVGVGAGCATSFIVVETAE